MTRLAWGGVALWLVVVVCGSGLAWIAIDEAGRGITSKAPSSSATTITRAPTGATRTPSPRPRPTRTASTAPSVPTKSSPPVSPTRVRTWTGTAGSVTVACTGSTAALRSATPADGWRGEVDDGGRGVQVKFERNDVTVVVNATCSDGQPRFRVGPED